MRRHEAHTPRKRWRRGSTCAAPAMPQPWFRPTITGLIGYSISKINKAGISGYGAKSTRVGFSSL